MYICIYVCAHMEITLLFYTNSVIVEEYISHYAILKRPQHNLNKEILGGSVFRCPLANAFCFWNRHLYREASNFECVYWKSAHILGQNKDK